MTTLPDPIDLTRTLVRINTLPPGGLESRCIEPLADLLSSAGYQCRVVDMAPGRGTLVARIGGRPDKAPIAFTGHVDVVPLGSAGWTQDPWGADVVDGRLYGRGSSDMKSGVAAFTVAALAGGSDVGVAGVIDVTVHNSSTRARVHDAELIASGRSDDASRGVRVKAEDKGNILRAAGAAGISFGSAGASGAVSLMIGRSSAQAAITSSLVDAPAITVEALNRKQMDNYTIGLGVGGGAGVGGTLSLVMLGTAPASSPWAS